MGLLSLLAASSLLLQTPRGLSLLFASSGMQPKMGFPNRWLGTVLSPARHLVQAQPFPCPSPCLPLRPMRSRALTLRPRDLARTAPFP